VGTNGIKIIIKIRLVFGVARLNYYCIFVVIIFVCYVARILINFRAMLGLTFFCADADRFHVANSLCLT